MKTGLLVLAAASSLFAAIWMWPMTKGSRGSSTDRLAIVTGRDAEGPATANPGLDAAHPEKRRPSAEEVEAGIARDMIAARQTMKSLSGGFDPGVHIVPDNGKKVDYKDIIAVPNGSLIDFERIFRDRHSLKAQLRQALRPYDDKLFIEPVAVGDTDLKSGKMFALDPAGTYLQGNAKARTELLKDLQKTEGGKTGWTGVQRVYSDVPGLGFVGLSETDTRADKGTVVVPESSLNARVGVYPASMMRMRDSAGRTMSELSWFDKRDRLYIINTPRIDDEATARLFAIANGIADAGR